MDELALDAETRRLLQRYGFDRATFDELRARLAAGEAGAEQNRIAGEVAPPEPEDVGALPPLGSTDRARLTELGLEAMGRGEVGAVVLAGGMATRFGGVVKAAVEAVPGHTFLDLKLLDARQVARASGGQVPLFAMTSFATHDTVARLLQEPQPTQDAKDAKTAEAFPQSVSLRLTPDGELLVDDQGRPSPYAPGHGDLTFSLRRWGVLERFAQAGGRLLFMSNVDNVAATLEPAVVGAHLESGAALTVEVVEKNPGDAGGAPARVDGRAQIVEAFRFPEAFDQDRIGVFNTNTLVLDVQRIDQDFPLTWFAVQKRVNDQAAVQFERLVGELTAFLPSRFLTVPREGSDGRFQPAKDPEELERRRGDMLEVLSSRHII